MRLGLVPPDPIAWNAAREPGKVGKLFSFPTFYFVRWSPTWPHFPKLGVNWRTHEATHTRRALSMDWG